MNSSSSESLFQKLATYVNTYKNAKCYWVQILAKKSFFEKWFGKINGKEYSHSRVYKISGDQFYKLLSVKNSNLGDFLEVFGRPHLSISFNPTHLIPDFSNPTAKPPTRKKF